MQRKVSVNNQIKKVNSDMLMLIDMIGTLNKHIETLEKKVEKLENEKKR